MASVYDAARDAVGDGRVLVPNGRVTMPDGSPVTVVAESPKPHIPDGKVNMCRNICDDEVWIVPVGSVIKEELEELEELSAIEDEIPEEPGEVED